MGPLNGDVAQLQLNGAQIALNGSKPGPEKRESGMQGMPYDALQIFGQS